MGMRTWRSADGERLGAEAASFGAEEQGHASGPRLSGAERADGHGLRPRREREERVAGLAQALEAPRPVGQAREGEGDDRARRDADGLAIEGIGGAGREEHRAGAKGQRIAEHRADIARVAQILENDDVLAVRFGEDRLRRHLGAALPDDETAVVELDAHDGLDNVLTHQVRGHARAGQRFTESVQAGGVTSADRIG